MTACEIKFYFKKLKCKFVTRKAEVLNSLIIEITANESDVNDILQTFR